MKILSYFSFKPKVYLKIADSQSMGRMMKFNFASFIAAIAVMFFIVRVALAYI
ncbi:MAG: hypothetical protein KDD40_02430 [Bdellovibrionales bacterium]|nr:hypothetical protein [Bdellovibrionales bacterium]